MNYRSHRLSTTSTGSALALLALMLSAPVAASEATWSVTLKAGQAGVDAEFDTGSYGWQADDENTSAGLAVGYTPLPFLGFELAYQDLGSYRGLPRPCEVCVLENEILVLAHPESVNFSGISLALVPRWPVTDRFVLFGKFGALDWRGDVTPYFASQNIEDPSETDLLAGLGARFGLSDALAVQLEYETTDLYDNLSLGAVWRF